MNKCVHLTVPADHPALPGHFPGMPILPGVVLLDWMLQAIVEQESLVAESCTIHSVKFLSPARPGDRLSLSHERLDSGAIRFDISAGTRKIATGSLISQALP